MNDTRRDLIPGPTERQSDRPTVATGDSSFRTVYSTPTVEYSDSTPTVLRQYSATVLRQCSDRLV